MLLRRAAALLPAVFVACSFPTYEFDDARYNAQNPSGGAGGDIGTAGTTGTAGKGGSTTTGGAGGGGGTESAGEGGSSAGEGGSSAGEGGSSAGEGGSSAGEGGSSAGEGGSNAGEGGSAGTGGTSAGTGGTTAGTGGTTAGTGGTGGTTAGTGGSTAGTGGTGGKPPSTCTTAGDCASNQLCSKPVDIGAETYFSCFTRNPDQGALKGGGVCTGPSDCESFTCLQFAVGATKGLCSSTCASAADCAAGGVCFEQFFSQNSSVRVCSPGCTSDSACDPGTGTACALYNDPLTDAVAFACQGVPSSALGFGETPTATDSCRWNLVVGSGADQKCTKPCDGPADCGAPFPACKSVPIGTPSGGTAVIKVCTAQ